MSEFVVHLVDDDDACLKATARLLRASDFQVKAFPSAAEFLAAISKDTSGCVVTDLRMPGMSGIELQDALVQSDHFLPVLFLTGMGDIPSTVHAMRNGAEDFLEKGGPRDQFLAAVRKALARAASEGETRKGRQALREKFATLTDREREVLGHILLGKLGKQIAGDLGISERTVKAHRSAIADKLNVVSVAEMTHIVRELGLWVNGQLTCPNGQ
jgi:FixJ family two-component response regulator